ncbi:MAG TPA: DJ-1/PfpI family protein, partial [Terrimicrobiaceae bacterium]
LGVVLYKNVQPMDVIGPWEVLAIWKNLLQAPIELGLISENGGLVKCDNSIALNAHYSFNDCPSLDFLLIPGGRGRREQVHNERLIAFIKDKAKTSEKILSVCTGMFLLHKAGLLADKRVTTYWRALSELKSFKDVVVEEQRVVKSGKIWTSGGVSSGIDLALEFIAEIAGKEEAGRVQLLLEYFPKQTIYCNLETSNSLPPYYGTKDQAVASYMSDLISAEMHAPNPPSADLH